MYDMKETVELVTDRLRPGDHAAVSCTAQQFAISLELFLQFRSRHTTACFSYRLPGGRECLRLALHVSRS